jgi:hypothetical protein
LLLLQGKRSFRGRESSTTFRVTEENSVSTTDFQSTFLMSSFAQKHSSATTCDTSKRVETAAKNIWFEKKKQMLSFQRQILKDLCPGDLLQQAGQEEASKDDDGDGLIILAHGLGLSSLLSLVINTQHSQATAKTLCLLINTPSHQLAGLQELIQTKNPSSIFHIIDSGTNSRDRALMYQVS